MAVCCVDSFFLGSSSSLANRGTWPQSLKSFDHWSPSWSLGAKWAQRAKKRMALSGHLIHHGPTLFQGACAVRFWTRVIYFHRYKFVEKRLCESLGCLVNAHYRILQRVHPRSSKVSKLICSPSKSSSHRNFIVSVNDCSSKSLATFCSSIARLWYWSFLLEKKYGRGKPDFFKKCGRLRPNS